MATPDVTSYAEAFREGEKSGVKQATYLSRLNLRDAAFFVAFVSAAPILIVSFLGFDANLVNMSRMALAVLTAWVPGIIFDYNFKKKGGK